MCGFVGCFSPDGRPMASGGVLEAMLAAIRHRGPDDEGFHLLSFNQGRSAVHRPGDSLPSGMDAGFGFARLSIQDLSEAGHQPMASRDRGVVLVFNGEIYNAAELREVLQARGLEFCGHSDTEVVLRLYEEFGWEAMLARIEGMFAIAIADVKTGMLRVARDPFGIKPLYHTLLEDGTLLIASEMKAFLQHPGFRAELATEHLAEQLMFRYTAWDRTLLRRVHQLPPGHVMIWRPGGAQAIHRYCTLPDAAEMPGAPEERVREALRRAVRSQLVSDVPLGTQLSGGIDSSLITLEAARGGGETRHSFSIVFGDPQFSEDVWITEAARKAGVHSHRYLFGPKQFGEDFARVAWHLDGPPGNPNTLALDLLARQARQNVKVLLTGEGCDELFAGYNRYYYTMLQQRHSGLFRLGARLGGNAQGRLWRVLGQAREGLERQIVAGSAYGAASLITELLPAARLEDALAQRMDHLNKIPGSALARQIRYETETYLPDLLLRQDKMTMAHGVECRVPFLDLGVVRAARSLPESSLLSPCYGLNARMRGTKRVIKKLAAAEFGQTFAYRKKGGFDVPLTGFFCDPTVMQRVREEWLPGLSQRGILEGRAVERVWECVTANSADKAAAEALWVAVGLEVWVRQVLSGSGEQLVNKK